MKTGRTLSELASELERQSRTKKDFVATTRALAVRPSQSGEIILEGVGGGMPLRQTAHEQLATTLAIPYAYYQRLQANAPDLLANNVNHWLKTEPQRKLVRTLDGGIRAILSDRYRPLDNAANAMLSASACTSDIRRDGDRLNAKGERCLTSLHIRLFGPAVHWNRCRRTEGQMSAFGMTPIISPRTEQRLHSPRTLQATLLLTVTTRGLGYGLRGAGELSGSLGR